jgi:tetratricopeptide (TPR) repeat protein
LSSRKLVFFGNCQALALERFCQRFLAPRSGDVSEVVNIADYDPAAARKSLDNADVIVSQVFDKPFDIDVDKEYKSHNVIKFPNVYTLFYWPYANQRHPRNDEVGTGYDVGPYPNEMGDSFLNRLILKKTAAEEALEQYLAQDVSERADRLFEVNGELQKQRDEASGFNIQRAVDAHFRDEHLFLTSAHPTMRIFSLVASGVFGRLGYEKARIVDALVAQRVAPFPRLALPIHPNVVSHFGLRFANAETRYPFFEEGEFTFAEYVRRYMNFEWNRQLHDALQLARSDPDRALPELDAALAASPRSATGVRVKADLLLRKHDHDAGKEAAARATALGPDDPRNWLTLSRAHRLAGEIDLAAAALDRAASLASRDPDGRLEGAHLAAERGLLPEAVEEARRAVEIEPGTARLWSALGDFLARARRFDEAVEAARRAVELDPTTTSYRFALADRLDQVGETEAAIASIREALGTGSSNPHDYARLAHLMARGGDFSGAEAAYRQAIDLVPAHTGFRLALADVLDRKGDLKGALETLKSVTTDGDRDPHTHARLGHLLARVEDYTGAVAVFRRAIELAPEHPGFQLALADVLDRAGDSQQALSIARDLAAKGARDGHLYARLGYFLVRTDDLAGAEAALRRAIEIDPETSHYRIQLADIIARGGRTDEAIKILQALASEGSADSNLHRRLGQLLALGGDDEAAEAAFRKAIEISPGDEVSKSGLAHIIQNKERNQRQLAETERKVVDEVVTKEAVVEVVVMAAVEEKSNGAAKEEIRGRSRSVRLSEGLSILRIAASEGQGEGVAGFAVPATQFLPQAGAADSVTIVSFAGAGKGWLGAEGGSVIVRAGQGGGIILATTYGVADDAVLPALQVIKLDDPTDVEQLFAANDAPQPASSPSPPEAAAPVPRGRELVGEVVLHIERQGDRRFSCGDWAGNPGAQLRIEGFAIRPVDTIAPGQIEYMGFVAGGRQTPWVTDVKLCGTRGRGVPLTGFAVRLTPALREQFDVVYEGHFFESGIRGPFHNGEPCLPAIVGDPLSAIRLRVIERPGA